MRIVCLVLAMLIAPAGAADLPAPWEPPAAPQAPEAAVAALGTAHGPRNEASRPHERWLPRFTLDFGLPRRLALDVVCDLGVLALAIEDCWTVAQRAPQPPEPMVLPRPSGGMPAPDFQELRRRTVEERMHSI